MNNTDLTKAELVAMINALPGPEVTTRPRKDTLVEILIDRQMMAMEPEEIQTCSMPGDNMPMEMPEDMVRESLLQRFWDKCFK